MVRTSAVKDNGSSKIPFLARDWMVFADVFIDIGGHVCTIREIGVTVPECYSMEMDTRSWRPPPLRQGHLRGHFRPRHWQPSTLRPLTLSSPIPLRQSRRSVGSTDFWEFRAADKVFVQHHRRPRVGMFIPDGSGPDASTLASERVTVASGFKQPIVDDWGENGQHVLPHAWVGATFFFNSGQVFAGMLASSGLADAVSLQVRAHLVDGTTLSVLPSQLREVNC